VRKHATDFTSLVAGLVFLAIGGAYLVGVMAEVHVEWKWVLPLALIGLGLAGLAGTISQARRQRAADDESAPPSPPADDTPDDADDTPTAVYPAEDNLTSTDQDEWP
jgi:hypothetical protein